VNHTARTRSSTVQNLTVSVIDVGYGDSILIQSPSGKTMLIDAGNDGKGDNVEEYLLSRGVTSLNIALVTHPHVDHFGGMPYILEHIPVAQFIDSGLTGNGYSGDVLDVVDDLGIPYWTVEHGDVIALDPLISIQVLNPQSSIFNDINDDSIILKVTYNQDTFILMGDGLSESNHGITTSELNSDVFKVGHHGDSDETPSALLSAISPEISMISVGSNIYGRPSGSLIDRLEMYGPVYRTDDDDTIIVTSNGAGYTVSFW
jgi:beta-lactamase superfamily II metal-dependent hydrolase